MTTHSLHHFSIDIDQGHGLGSPWIVRVYHKTFFGKRLVSSDWFLDQEQAEQFVRDATKSLQADQSADILKDRNPGWTLRRPSN